MEMIRTCNACPTQYDIHLDDGRYVYFRYRHGYWSFQLYATRADFWQSEPSLAEVGDSFVHPDGADGFMEHEQVVELLEKALPLLVAEEG